MASITIQKITKHFGNTRIIENLSLAIQDGEFVTLLGPSGCGKSTTLNMIAGLEPCTTGKIYFDKTDVTKFTPYQRDVAMVFQSYALYPHLKVFDNIAFPLDAQKVQRQEIQSRVAKVAEKLELVALLNRFPRDLSGGQRQRVALARAIVRTPKVFLFDEPLSNLDASLKVTTRSEIKKLHQDLKSTMIYVTHDQAEAMSLSDRIIIFSKGVVQQFDTPDAVYNRPANLFVATFIGSPAMNIWQGKISGRSILQVNDVQFTLPPDIHDVKDGDIMTIGIRPHHFTVAREPGEGRLPAEVITIQPMGECNFLDVKLAGKRTLVRAEATFTASPGEIVQLAYHKEVFHCFDENGQRKGTGCGNKSASSEQPVPEK